jgi:Ca-activated chloride channel family protein
MRDAGRDPESPAIYEHHDSGMGLTARLTTQKILVGSHSQNLVVTITAPDTGGAQRPPLSLAVVIDRSGSMRGAPMQNAKLAAAKLVDQLDENDAFTIITYSSGDETVMPISRAIPANKAAAHAAIERIYDDGGTCISCGIERGARELSHTPIVNGLERIVLISDGLANEGIFDRGELAQLATTTAARGVSISTVGVGLDFDEVTMSQLAQVGRGNYYFVEDTADLTAMFTRELGGLAATIASNVRLSLTGTPHTQIVEAYGYPLTREGNQVLIPIADLRANESRKVVLRVDITSPRPQPRVVVSQVTLTWHRVADAQPMMATTAAVAEIVDSAGAVAGSVDRRASFAVEQAQTARALDEATDVYERQGYDAARRVIEQRVESMKTNAALGAADVTSLEAASGQALRDFAAAPPAKAKKSTRAKAYELAR